MHQETACRQSVLVALCRALDAQKNSRSRDREGAPSMPAASIQNRHSSPARKLRAVRGDTTEHPMLPSGTPHDLSNVEQAATDTSRRPHDWVVWRTPQGPAGGEVAEGHRATHLFKHGSFSVWARNRSRFASSLRPQRCSRASPL